MSDLLKTRAWLRKAQGDLAGWRVRVHETQDPGVLSEQAVTLYVCNPQTDWMWCGTVDLLSWQKVGAIASASRLSAQDIQRALGYLLKLIMVDAPEALSAEDHQRLGLLTACYARTTEVFKVAGGFEQGGHFIVLHYAKQQLLRPFGSSAKGLFLNTDELKATIQQVWVQDRHRHPEWF